MKPLSDSLANWTPEQIAQTKKWIETWRLAGPELEKLRREELRVLDAKKELKEAPEIWSELQKRRRDAEA